LSLQIKNYFLYQTMNSTLQENQVIASNYEETHPLSYIIKIKTKTNSFNLLSGQNTIISQYVTN